MSEMGDMKFTTAGDMMKDTVRMIDPPSGWKYGSPKAIPSTVENVLEWLVEQGYPQAEIDACGDHFYCRYREREV